MPRPSAYTPARRLLLQAVLLLILIGAVGLAKVVTRYKLRAAVVKLAPPVRFDDLSVSLPAGWSITFPPATAPTGPRLVRATEPAPAAGLPGRVLTVARDHTDIPLPPLEYLLTSRLMPADYAPSLGGVGHLAPPATTPVDGQPGFLVAGLRPVRASTGQVLPKKEIFATAMLPSRDVLTVRLEGIGQDLDDDLDLVRQIAASLSLPSNAAAALSTGPVTLPNGPTVKPPPGFVTLPEPDPHLTERHLLRAAPPTRYADLTLVPCVFFPDSDDQDTFRTMLTVRDAEWLDARITAPGKNVLRADLPLRAGLPFPRRAYLLTSPTGHALLVELHAGSPADAADFDDLLKQVADSATPPAAGPNPTDLLAAGTAEVNRLRNLTLPFLLEGLPTDSWWLWTFAGRPAGWSHLSFEPGDPSHGTIDDHIRAAGGVTVAVRYAFETSPDLARHNDSTLRRAVTPAGHAVDQFKEDTSLVDSKYALVIMPNPATGQLARAVRPAPDAFLPGPWLPLLTPKLSHQDMILRTTRLPGLEAAAITAPLTVRLHPTTRPATFDVDVSGTGQVMTLSPTSMQLSNTTARTHTTPADLQKIFPHDPAFSPKP